MFNRRFTVVPRQAAALPREDAGLSPLALCSWTSQAWHLAQSALFNGASCFPTK